MQLSNFVPKSVSRPSRQKVAVEPYSTSMLARAWSPTTICHTIARSSSRQIRPCIKQLVTQTNKSSRTVVNSSHRKSRASFHTAEPRHLEAFNSTAQRRTPRLATELALSLPMSPSLALTWHNSSRRAGAGWTMKTQLWTTISNITWSSCKVLKRK